MRQADPFITKVMPPKRSFGLIRRDRLHHTLSRAVDRHRVALVTAPAGYGKTALVADFASELRAPVCWYSADPEDNNLRTFFRFLVAALRRQFPDFGDGTRHVLNSASDLAPVLSTVVGTLVSEIQQQIPDWFVLVLEDLHWCDDPTLLPALDLMLRRLPDNCFVLITSRTRPALKTLSRLSVERSLTRLTARDLAFKEDEVLELLRSAGHNVGSGIAKKLTEESEGWIAGIILLSPWLDQPSFLASLDTVLDHDDLFLYLSEEVFQRLPERWQEFLVTTSIVQDVAVDLCIRAFGYLDAASLLKEMERAGLFLTELHDGATYRYHALFRQFLLDRAGRDPEEFSEGHVKAADFYAGRGQWAEAVLHYLAADCPERAVSVLEGCAPELYQRGEWAVLAEMAGNLQQQAVPIPPRLLLWRARCLVHLGEPDAALQLAERAALGADPAGDSTTAALREMVRSGALRSKGNADEAMASARSALRHAEDAADEQQIWLLRGEAHHQIGACLFTAGRHREALPELETASELYATLGSVYHLARLNMVLGSTLYRLGRYPEAIARYEQVIDGSRRLGNSATLASTLNNLGNLYISLGSYGLAEDVLRSSLEAARLCGNTRVEAYVTHSLGDALAGSLQFEEAAELLRGAIDLCREAGETVLEARVLLSLARVCSRLNSIDEAQRLLERASTLIAANPRPYDLGLLSFSMATATLRREDFAEARCQLSDALERFELSGELRWSERALLLLAQAEFMLGDLESALGHLQRLWATAESEVGPAALRQEASLARDVLACAVDTLPDASAFVRLRAAADAALAVPTNPASLAQVPTPGRPVVKAYSLGAFALELDGAVIDEACGLTPKAKELLFFLLTAGRRARREELIEALWPESETQKDASVLRTNVYRLRRVLYDECIVVQGNFYKLDPVGHFWSGLHYFKELLHRSRQSQCSAVERLLLLETAMQVYRGPFLDELSSEWCATQRYDLEVRFASASLTLASIYLDNADPIRAIPLCERILAGDPFNEDAVLLLVRAYLSTGDRGSAALRWRAFERRLQSEAGVRPSLEAASQYRRLIEQHKVAS